MCVACDSECVCVCVLSVVCEFVLFNVADKTSEQSRQRYEAKKRD